ncbi:MULTISPECIES: glycosyltransferase [unclassified Leeuwenhoekiella]|mgnify:CR=1 FL=1|uniref:glycosyltransferase n=1 Tax=unclassified Leeuwenhoekiella TaxID=2615029 RepID=UPI000C4B6C1A|nr:MULTISPECIES: glycosyltransferase [unclassified Leeuwenhoekiella]MAW97090.1 glycosyl transferase family 1 [Leeuwenhoekiella sp.]MBA82606.1 glycosyl transferase family 1 [Leeuwenhoekiella sp.]
MRVLRIIATMDPVSGGPCQGIRNSIPALDRLGVHTEVVSFDSPDADFLKKDGFTIHALGPARGPYSYAKKYSDWLRKHIRDFDILIIHGLWLYNSYGTYRIWNNAKRTYKNFPALFVMPHGMLDPYFQKAPERRLKAIRNRMFWNLFESRVINQSSGVLFTCQQELELARTTFNSYRPNLEINVGYGIQSPPSFKQSFDKALRIAVPDLKDQSYWLFLSRVHKKKGVDLLVKSYLKLLNKHQDIPDLIIAGPGLETEFGKRMLQLGKHQKIHFPGMLVGDSKWGAFYGCDAFVLPSHQENFGIAVAEAMACEKPVLISDQVNIWREIAKGGGGLICQDLESSTYETLARFNALSNLERANMGHCARNVYLEHFSIDKAAKKMHNQLNSALKK